MYKYNISSNAILIKDNNAIEINCNTNIFIFYFYKLIIIPY